jgi:hypothetical protein
MKAVPIDDAEDTTSKFKAVPIDTVENPKPEKGQQMSDLSYPELAKNALLGMSSNFEESVAGMLGPLAPQSWTDKIAAQNEWKRTHAGTGWGDIAADTAKSIPLMFAGPPGIIAKGTPILKNGIPALAKEASLIRKAAQPFMQIATDAAGNALLTGATSTEDRTNKAEDAGITAGLFSVGGHGFKAGHEYGAKGLDWFKKAFDPEQTQRLADVIDNIIGKNDKFHVGGDIKQNQRIVHTLPGEQLTAGALSNNSKGVTAMETIGRNANPQMFGEIDLNNVNVRKNEFVRRGGTEQNVADTGQVLKQAGDSLYSVPRSQSVRVDPELRDIMARPMMRDAFASLIKSSASHGTPVSPQMINSVLNGRNGAAISGDAIHQMKVALDEHLKDAKNPFAQIKQKDVQAEIKAFEDWRERKFPAYHTAQTEFKRISKPFNRASALNEMRKGVYPEPSNYANSLEQHPNSLANDLGPDSTITDRIPGYANDLRDVITSSDYRRLNRMTETMKREQEGMGGGGGSLNDEGNIQSRISQIPAAIASVSGNPSAYPVVNAAMYSKLESMKGITKKKLGEAIADPNKFLELLNYSKGDSWLTQIMNDRYANTIPGIMGQVTANNEQRKTKKKSNP